jgi:hypothetical protein
LTLWRSPLYSTVHAILTNPVYAGAYAFGRTTNKVSVEAGRKRVRRGMRRPLAEWDVLLKDQHEGFISWTEFETNQRVIAPHPISQSRSLSLPAARRTRTAMSSQASAEPLRASTRAQAAHLHDRTSSPSSFRSTQSSPHRFRTDPGAPSATRKSP